MDIRFSTYILERLIARVGFEPHDLEVMGLASTPDCSTPLYQLDKRITFKGF